MQVTITKQDGFDRIAIRRANGSVTETRFPKKGPLPHDAIHYFVEDSLALRNAFWGMIASGIDPEKVQEIAKDAGHASAKRATIPQAHIVELLQAERLVECFEAELWGGPSDPATFRDVAQSACEASHVPLPDLDDQAIGTVREKIAALRAQWVPAPAGHSFGFAWPQ